MQPDCKKIHVEKLLASIANKRDSLLGGKRDNQLMISIANPLLGSKRLCEEYSK